MPTLRQVEANRRNAQKSTGPRTLGGKAASRFNALKTGVDAKAQVIPGENSADLEALAAEYHERFRPAAPEHRFLVDTLVNAEWQLRRLRKVEAQLWEYEMESAFSLSEHHPLGHVFSTNLNAFNRLQRRIDSAERTYLRALNQLQRLQSEPEAAVTTEPQPADARDCVGSPQSPSPQLASFRDVPVLVPAAPPEHPDAS
jgi:hypothetical protein